MSRIFVFYTENTEDTKRFHFTKRKREELRMKKVERVGRV